MGAQKHDTAPKILERFALGGQLKLRYHCVCVCVCVCVEGGWGGSYLFGRAVLSGGSLAAGLFAIETPAGVLKGPGLTPGFTHTAPVMMALAMQACVRVPVQCAGVCIWYCFFNGSLSNGEK